MHNLILATIAVIFAGVVVGGGLNYFQPSVMARLNVGDPLALGFERLGTAWTAYTIANGEPPRGSTELVLSGGGCWWDQLAPYGSLPAAPSELNMVNNGCGGPWHYERSLLTGLAYFCVFVNDDGSGDLGAFLFDAVRRGMKKLSSDIDVDALPRAVGMSEYYCDTIQSGFTSDASFVRNFDWSTQTFDGFTEFDTHPDTWPDYTTVVGPYVQTRNAGFSLVYFPEQ